MTHTFTHSGPGRLHCGPGALRSLCAELPRDTPLLVVADAGLVGVGLTAGVTETLTASGLTSTLHAAITPDPTTAAVEEALEHYRDTGAGAILALGGGSAIDAAKGVAALAAGGGTLREYGDGRVVTGPLPSLYALPTTAGTGSEATRVAVITDQAEAEKMSIRGECLLPLAAALDPDLLTTLPAPLAAATGADALAHAVEAYVSRRATPLSDRAARSALAGIGCHLRPFVADRTDREAGLGMLLAANLAGQAFTNAGLGLTHSLGEPFGAWHHVGHGLACALYLPVVMEFNLPAARERFGEVHRLLSGAAVGDPEAAAPAVRALFADLALPSTFAEMGIEFELRGEMIEAVPPQQSTACNPRTPTESEIEALYRAPGLPPTAR